MQAGTERYPLSRPLPYRASRFISASDRSGLLYAVARVLAQYRINLQLAKVSTLGERVEDTFLVDAISMPG
jgi:UTP:GlnB (protein PII) uridylyltransferase